MVSYSKFVHNYTKSYFKYEEPVSTDFKVFLNGEEIPVYTCRISKAPLNRMWPGYQRPIDQTYIAAFVNIVADEDVDIEVKVNNEYKKIYVKPYSANIDYKEDNGRVSFKLPAEQDAVLHADDSSRTLYIFNSKPVTCENPDEVTHYFGPGIYFPGKITLHDNESIYVDKDALVFGCIYAENAKNIKIFGNGLFDDSTEERVGNYCYEEFINGNIKFYDCRNVKVEGVLFKNSAIWCVNIFHCFDVVMDGIKVFGQWRYNTDGVDIVNSQDITLKNSFVHSFDDTVTIKGIDRYAATDNKNIHVDNCILWCDWGRACEIGLETMCREYENISFKNCDILHVSGVVLDVQNGDCAEVHDVTFENINVEYNPWGKIMYLDGDEKVDVSGGLANPILVGIFNYRFRSGSYVDDWGIPADGAAIDLTGIKQACNHDITVKNINVYYDEDLPLIDGEYDIRFSTESSLPEVEYYNINIENVVVNGKKIK